MHGHRNIGLDSFPRQGRFLGRRVAVLFPRSESTVSGAIVRDDVDSPDVQIVLLDDGRLVVKGEWAHLEVLALGDVEPASRVVAPEYSEPTIVTGHVPPFYFDTPLER